jgi:rsbT co-antagonist protein RsbR
MGRAVRLLGAECVLSGVNPAVAQTITHMGLDLDGIAVFRTLGTALRQYVAVSLAQGKRRLRPAREEAKK